jgi:NAD(P)H-flavin reductase
VTNDCIRDPIVPTMARVRSRRRETPDTWTLEIEPDDRRHAWSFVPGQFNMLYVFGVGESAISLSGDPARSDRLLHTVRAVGPVSRGIDRLSVGASVGVRGPFGTGWPVDEADGADIVVVAGGLGLAPLRPALYRLLATRRRYGRIVLLYGTRSPENVLFAKELDRWRRSREIDVEITVDHALGGWNGHVGVVTRLISRASFDPSSTVAMICGPEVMMRFAIAALKDSGLDDRSVYLSMERNMKCAVGHCGHCQFGPAFICKDGPVLRCDRVAALLALREI